ncbi:MULTISPECIES: hypothetical protein [Wolbachia]|uniref:hypothetical protein n=1 Tax=Wolbachia TaxID=953 RepID=UPI002232C8FE|nr:MULTISPECIES: hypothetical protein [unclassified Wolbachia]
MQSLRHTAIHSRYLLAANKQRDDDCQGVIQVASFLSSQCLGTGMTKKGALE